MVLEMRDTMNDYEIASKVKPLHIRDIADKLNIKEESLEYYGNNKAKITASDEMTAKGKLILVTSTSPTPYGEGKTTLAIGIHDALCKIGEQSLVVLREPSLGPVFGTKGGATGGGYSQVIPMEDINLHFTGDIHAITAANNLLAAIIDNHLFHGNELNLDASRISFERCLDVNDRVLRKVDLPITNRRDKFNISTASEIMAILCLSKDIDDLKEKLGNIFIGYTLDDKEIFARDLHAEGALTVLLKDAIKPNLVQTLENNPAIIHGGPFANIAHGCNSIIATKLGLNLADYVVTEAGFGSDMGALKFLDIKCRQNNIYPDMIVLNTTIRGLKYNGHDNLEIGLSNLEYHVTNMKKFSSNVLVVLNKFATDTEREVEVLCNYCNALRVPFAISTCHQDGSDGGIEVANTIVDMLANENQITYFPYEVTDSLQTKIEKVCKDIYYAKEIKYKDGILEKIEKLDQYHLPICIAKTPYSITDDPKKLGFPKNSTMTVTDVKLNHGAGFITVYMGNIMTMPGLSSHANYLNMDYIDGTIKGIF